jgi:hypothetical protein
MNRSCLVVALGLVALAGSARAHATGGGRRIGYSWGHRGGSNGDPLVVQEHWWQKSGRYVERHTYYPTGAQVRPTEKSFRADRLPIQIDTTIRGARSHRFFQKAWQGEKRDLRGHTTISWSNDRYDFGYSETRVGGALDTRSASVSDHLPEGGLILVSESKGKQPIILGHAPAPERETMVAKAQAILAKHPQ